MQIKGVHLVKVKGKNKMIEVGHSLRWVEEPQVEEDN